MQEHRRFPSWIHELCWRQKACAREKGIPSNWQEIAHLQTQLVGEGGPIPDHARWSTSVARANLCWFQWLHHRRRRHKRIATKVIIANYNFSWDLRTEKLTLEDRWVYPWSFKGVETRRVSRLRMGPLHRDAKSRLSEDQLWHNQALIGSDIKAVGRADLTYEESICWSITRRCRSIRNSNWDCYKRCSFQWNFAGDNERSLTLIYFLLLDDNW